MEIIVTGAASFVGAAAVREFLNRGHRVLGILRPDSKTREVLETSCREWIENGQLILVENDLQTPEKLPGLIGEKLSGTEKCFFHFGWGGSGSGARNDRELQKNNLEASLNTIRAAKELGCGRFFFSGSQAEYGLHREMTTEESVCAPRSAYGEAKLAMRRDGEILCKSLGIRYIHGRIFSVYGPGDHPWTLVETCLDACMNGMEIRLGACTQLWNFLYMDDLARALADLADLPEDVLASLDNPVFNLAGEETKPLKSFVEEINSLCGGRGTLVYGARIENAEGLVHLNPSIEKLKTVTGWRQETDFRQGIQKLMIDKREKKDTMGNVDRKSRKE